MIKAFEINNAPKHGYNFKRHGKVFAWGVRDSLEFDQDNYGQFWNVDNGADGTTRDSVFIGKDNPADEINNLGRVDQCYDGKPPPNFGFPYCHAVWNVSFSI